MTDNQIDLFSRDDIERGKLSDVQRLKIRSRLEATLAKLASAATFPWRDPLDAVHEENRFQYDAEMLGEEGALLWSRFDEEMDRLHATQSAPDARAAGPTH